MRRRILTGLVAVLAVSWPALRAAVAAPLRSVGEIHAVGEWNLRQPHPLRLEGMLTWVDPQRQLVVLQDAAGAVALQIDPAVALPPVGRRIAVETTDAWPALAIFPDFPLRPTGRDHLSSFEGPTDWKTNYVARVRGFLFPPVTGEYRFRIASDDTSQLWLGTDDQPGSARPIAAVSIWTKAREWTHLPEQQSAPIFLEAGRRYYIEAVHEQRWRADHLSVSWEAPGVPHEIIPGRHLSAWTDAGETDSAAARGRVLREYWLERSLDNAALLTAPRRLDSTLVTLGAVVRDLGAADLPVPRATQPGEPLALRDNFLWSELEGVVDFVARQGSTLVMDLVDGMRRTRAIIPNFQRDPPSRLSGQRVRLQGIGEAALNESGQPVLGTLWIPSASTIAVIEDSGRLRDARPVAIAELLLRPPTGARERLVKVRGRVVESAEGQMTLTDAGAFYGYVSRDGIAWEPLGAPVEIPMGADVEIGLVVNSRSTENIATATFDHVQGLSPSLTQTTVGGPTRAGELRRDDGTIILRGSGHDIWIAPDQFHFAHQRLSGAGEIVARITQFDTTDPWAKAGLMMRDSLAPDAQFVDLVQTGANGCALQWRKAGEGSAPLSSNNAALRAPHWLKLARRFNTIAVVGARVTAFPPGTRVEVVGEIAAGSNGIAITDASCRELTEEVEKPTSAMQARPLVELARVLGAPGTVERYDLFKTRAVATFVGEVAGRRYVAVQDHSGAAFVEGNLGRRVPPLRAGHFVEIHSNPGWNLPSPNLTAAEILVLGDAAFPPPLKHPHEYSLPRRGEAAWVEVEGIVRSVAAAGIGEVKTNREAISFAVHGVAVEALRRHIDARVRLRGAMAFPSEDERLLLVPSLDHVEVTDAPPPHPFASPVQPVDQLIRAKLRDDSPHRVRVQGTVTFADRAFLHVQDATGGARLDLAEPTAAKVGEVVDAIGFPEAIDGRSVVLASALVRPTGSTATAVPDVLTDNAMLGPSSAGRLVRLHAVVTRLRTGEGETTFELQMPQQTLRATLGGAPEELPSIPPGSLVALTGVCALETGRASGVLTSAEPSRRLLLRSVADLVVLQKPRWWVVKRTLLVTSVIAFVLLVSFVWIHILRRRVAQRTAELRATMEKLRRETQTAATLAERNRLAGEIHDSLEQGFSGLILQLDTTAKKTQCPPEVRAGLALARNMVAFSRNEARHAVWDLQSPVLENSDLGTALKEIVAQLAPETPHSTVTVVNAPRPLSSAVEHHLLRIAQEAITNCIKHAEARNLDVTLTFAPHEVALAVRDDGRGFVPEKVLAGGVGHFGLRSLRGRASKIQGTLAITSEPGRGTTVEIRVATPPTVTL